MHGQVTRHQTNCMAAAGAAAASALPTAAAPPPLHRLLRLQAAALGLVLPPVRVAASLAAVAHCVAGAAAAQAVRGAAARGGADAWRCGLMTPRQLRMPPQRCAPFFIMLRRSSGLIHPSETRRQTLVWSTSWAVQGSPTCSPQPLPWQQPSLPEPPCTNAQRAPLLRLSAPGASAAAAMTQPPSARRAAPSAPPAPCRGMPCSGPSRF